MCFWCKQVDYACKFNASSTPEEFNDAVCKGGKSLNVCALIPVWVQMCVYQCVRYHQAHVANCHSWVSWRWERKRGVPPHSASWCFPRCWEGSGCADHTGTQCCDCPAGGKTKSKRVHVRYIEIISKSYLRLIKRDLHVYQFVSPFCVWASQMWSLRIKESGEGSASEACLPFQSLQVIQTWVTALSSHRDSTDTQLTDQRLSKFPAAPRPLWVGVHVCVIETAREWR